MLSKIPSIDMFSFWLGFFLAAFLLIVLNQLRKLLPRLRKISQQNKIVTQLSRNIGLLTKVRKYLLHRYQSFHIANNLFPLNQIYIEPGLLQCTIVPDPSKETPEAPLLYSIVPVIPEASSLLFDLPVSRLTLSEILSLKSRLVISGEVGSGKTALLSYFASNILEKGKETQGFHDFLPIIVHANELDITDSGSKDCLSILLDTVTFSGFRSQLKELFDSLDIYAKSGKLIFILDGLDEQPEATFQSTLNWLVKCTNTYPNSKYIVPSGPFYVDGFEKMGFMPFSIAPLDTKQQIAIIDNWQSAWDQVFQNSSSVKTIKRFTQNWLKQETLSKSRFLLTLQILGYFSGENVVENSDIEIIKNYATSICGNKCSVDQLSVLSRQIGTANFPGLSMMEIGNIFSQGKHETAEVSSPNEQIQKVNITGKFISSGFLTERRPGLYAFSNLIIFSFLFGRNQDIEVTEDWLSYLHFPVNELILRFSRSNSYIRKWLTIEDKPLYRNFLLIANHVSKLSLESDENKLIFKTALSFIKSTPTTFSSLLRILPVFVENYQTDTNQFFAYLSNDSNPNTRKFAALGVSFGNHKQAIPVLAELTKDKNPEVASLACIFLSKFWNLQSQKILVEIILHGSELLRRIVAEVFSTIKPEGYEILKELSTIDNILARKSSIFGLRMINEDWVLDFLHKIIAEDTEWLVKDTTVHAIENYPYKQQICQNQLLVNNNIPWLIQYANTIGLAVPNDGFPFDLIENVLINGKPIEQAASLDLLGRNSDNRSIGILKSISIGQNPLSEIATEMLYKISRRGLITN